MCYFLYIASPLTLSEVRSMLPAGLTADLAPTSRAAIHRLHPPARTVAQLLVGACSCDLFRARQTNSIEDERELRSRYSRMKLPRSEVIEALERHRRGPPRPPPAGGWSEALAGFVIEHARNAGQTLYLLDFAPQPAGVGAGEWGEPEARSVSEVRLQRDRWLVEGKPVIVG